MLEIMMIMVIMIKITTTFNNFQMVVKVKEKFEKTRHVKSSDKSKKYIVRGERNVRYHERILSNKKKSYYFN